MLIEALRELGIADRKSDIEQRLTVISGRRMLLSNKMADVAAQKLTAARAAIVNNEESDAEGTDNVSVKNSEEYEAIYDFEIKQIQASELVLDTEKQRLETEYQALSSEEEGTKKLKDKNIEKSFGYMKN